MGWGWCGARLSRSLRRDIGSTWFGFPFSTVSIGCPVCTTRSKRRLFFFLVNTCVQSQSLWRGVRGDIKYVKYTLEFHKKAQATGKTILCLHMCNVIAITRLYISPFWSASWASYFRFSLHIAGSHRIGLYTFVHLFFHRTALDQKAESYLPQSCQDGISEYKCLNHYTRITTLVHWLTHSISSRLMMTIWIYWITSSNTRSSRHFTLQAQQYFGTLPRVHLQSLLCWSRLSNQMSYHNRSFS